MIRETDQVIAALKWYADKYPADKYAWLWNIVTDNGQDPMLLRRHLVQLYNNRSLVNLILSHKLARYIPEINTIIGALRWWQRSGFCDPYRRPNKYNILEPLSFDEINALCKWLNRTLSGKTLSAGSQLYQWRYKG